MSESEKKKIPARWLAIDTETDGLYPYQGNNLFAVSVWGEAGSYYLDLREHSLEAIKEVLTPFCSDPSLGWFLANAKFDMAFLWKIGVEFIGPVHDVLVMDRLIENYHMSYSLDSVAMRTLGEGKSKGVEQYMKAHKLKTFDKVPLEVMREYALKDVELTYRIGVRQLEKLQELDSKQVALTRPSLMQVYWNEVELTKVLFEMERRGVRIDEAYCKGAIEYEEQRCLDFRRTFKELTGEEYLDSNKNLTRLFNGRPRLSGADRRTKKGNLSWDDVSLQGMGELGRCILGHRGALKRKSTYYENFLRYSDRDGILHANVRQGGTATGRFSYSDPNLQNLEKEEEGAQKEAFEVKGCFIPQEDFCLVELDYKAVEFRMMLNYAKEYALMDEIRKGLDPHQATADMVGITRQQAKMLNFAVLYGAGPSKISGMLGITDNEAKTLRKRYFRRLPNVMKFIYETTARAESRQYIFNWYGRLYGFPEREFAYKACNYLIQGGCSETLKIAMVRLGGYLADKKSRMLISIHDAVLFEIHRSELTIVKELQNIMEGVYPGYLPLECDVKYSWESWASMRKGYPDEPETRDQIQDALCTQALAAP